MFRLVRSGRWVKRWDRPRGAVSMRQGPLSLIALALSITLGSSSVAASEPDPWFSSDKSAHFGVSAGIATASYLVAAACFDARGPALLTAGGVTIVVGAGKEAFDLAGFGTPSWKDFAWDGIGAVVGLALAWGVDLLLRGTGDTHPPFAAPRHPTARAPRAVELAF
jgi:putative lipoprotein